jgi:hypothetical protein
MPWSPRRTTPEPSWPRPAPAPSIARDVDGGVYLQNFLVTTVAAILLTRFYLGLTGFPQVGNGELHIAHLLWGGVLMLAALILLLAVIGKRTKRLGALLGGIGFGLFLDELGKFITRDNDYFFQPTIALIYVVLIGLFFTFRWIEHRRLSAEELLANAADSIRELVLGGATDAEVARARGLLERSRFRTLLADRLLEAIDCVACIDDPTATPPLAVRFSHWLWRTYDHLLAWSWFQAAVQGVFLIQGLIGVLIAVGLAVGWMSGRVDARAVLAGTDRVATAMIIAALCSLGLAVAGLIRLPISRLDAYHWFERSVLVSVFFTQVLMFWEAQLAALGGLLVDLVLLVGLRYMLRQEGARRLQPPQASGVEPVYSRM